jgi:HK97 family phage prohead protease
MKKEQKFLRGKISIQKGEKGITVIASDETLDRHGDVLPIDQWDLKKFKLSPRMLVDHNHEVASIVGKWNNVRIEGKKLLMDADFHDFTDLAVAVKKMVEEGYLDTVSVGFIWNGPDKDGGKASFELIETSWVTVPANPSARVTEALKDVLGKGISADAEQKVKNFAGETKSDEDNEIEESDEVLPEDEEDIPLEGEDELEDPVEPVIVPPVDDEIPEGERSIDSVATLKELEPLLEGRTKIVVDLKFLRELLADSEQLKTLTDEGLEVLRAKKQAEIIRVSMKEAAGIISHALREANKARA